MALERGRHGARVLLPEPRGTLEIGEQERHRSRRQLLHVSPWQVAAGLLHDPTRWRTRRRIRCPALRHHPLSSTAWRTDPTADRARAVQPELVDGRATTDTAAAPAAAEAEGEAAAEQSGEQISSPTKLIRIASMVRTMLDEVRRAPLDDAGRRSLQGDPRAVDPRARGASSPPTCARSSTEVDAAVHERRRRASRSCGIAQAQLVGWLEGLFHGIQATLFTQQVLAQQPVRGDAPPPRARAGPRRRRAHRPERRTCERRRR